METRDTRTWIAISARAARQNVKTIRGLLSPKTALWAVVKSNAYGHGIFVMPKLLSESGVDGFCVDTLLEGARLREQGITKSILVLGLTLPQLFPLAQQHDIAITVSNFDALACLLKVKNPPRFHLKLDTGMHRQGFFLDDLARVVQKVKSQKSKVKSLLSGIYTHFASAKDLNYPGYTDMQFADFLRGIALLERAGFKKLIRHAAATGGAMIDKKYHLDAVRIGAGLYGIWPSKELEIQLPNVRLSPALSWHAIVGEVKPIQRGEYIGYNLVYRAPVRSKIAIIPIGYWHGFPFALSNTAEVLIRGRRARVVGRVSMDMITVDVGHIPNCRFGDEVVLIGAQGGAFIGADELARFVGASHNYEILTRLNPLIERVAVY